MTEKKTEKKTKTIDEMTRRELQFEVLRVRKQVSDTVKTLDKTRKDLREANDHAAKMNSMFEHIMSRYSLTATEKGRLRYWTQQNTKWEGKEELEA